MMAIKSFRGFRKFQLACMGWAAIIIAPLTLIVASAFYQHPFLQSISESGTISNQSSFILPFILGALALFALSYALMYAYDYVWDKVFTLCMAIGFTIVATFPCKSPYIITETVGIIPVPPSVSNIIHSVGAIIGFGAMILWILICFKRSDKPRHKWTEQKVTRNTCYTTIGILMLLSLGLFAINLTGIFGKDFPIVFVCEAILLTLSGTACLIKSEMFLKDVNLISGGAEEMTEQVIVIKGENDDVLLAETLENLSDNKGADDNE